MKIGIQGEQGSACDVAATRFLEGQNIEVSLEYFHDADQVLSALASDLVDAAVLALESPVGVPVPETAEALRRYPVVKLAELEDEVHDCIMTLSGEDVITKVASHPIVLEKHREYLHHRFPGHQPIAVADTGLAASYLAEGELSPDTAVIAMPTAAEIFGLTIVETKLPANDNYLTRFSLVRKDLAIDA